MEHHASWLTHLVNQVLGAPALALLKALHITPSYPDTPIPEHVVMALTVLVVGTLLALVLRSRLSVERPGASQQIAELLLTNSMGFGINDVLEENSGHDWKKYVPMVGTIAIFILLANLFGVFPFLSSPTANATVPLACAVITFVYFNWQGLRHHGPVGYAKTFTGGVHWSLWILIFPVEVLSSVARLLSLTVRLWANIFASDLIYVLFLGLFTGLAVWAGTKSAIAGVVLGVFPALAPIAFIALHVFVSVVQTYVFAILPAVYIGLATADDH
jgi:F-type H+-transporting ATPase subunit a